MYHLTLKSTNSKTGPIPVSVSSAETCPSACPLSAGGCYAQGGPLAIHWRKVTQRERGTDWRKFCKAIAGLPAGQLWRHNAAGDLPSKDRVHIDRVKFMGLVMSNVGRRGFTYTHYDPRAGENAALLFRANAAGFTVNLSANNLVHADQLADLACGPVAVVMPEDCARRTLTPAGRPVVQCPATYQEGRSCDNCALCASAERSVIVGFPAHGSGKRKAESVIRLYRSADHAQAN